jgi:hypothetical protein
MHGSHHVFQHLISQCEDLEPIVVAVAYPCDDISLLGALEAAQQRLIVPVPVGLRTAIISTPESRVSAWVIPTDEDLMIARHTRQLIDVG